MTNFELKVQNQANKAVSVIEKWTKEKNAQEVIQDFLNEKDIETGNTNLRDLLQSKKKLATSAKNELVALEAIKSFIKLANGGSEEDDKRGGLPSGNQFIINVNPVKADAVEINSKVINGDESLNN